MRLLESEYYEKLITDIFGNSNSEYASLILLMKEDEELHYLVERLTQEIDPSEEEILYLKYKYDGTPDKIAERLFYSEERVDEIIEELHEFFEEHIASELLLDTTSRLHYLMGGKNEH